VGAKIHRTDRDRGEGDRLFSNAVPAVALDVGPILSVIRAAQRSAFLPRHAANAP
jgi:hypothetical protein